MAAVLPMLAGWLVEAPWAIPVIGIFVSCLAFVVGRRLLPNRPAQQSETLVAEGSVYLHGMKVDRRAIPRRAGRRLRAFHPT